jgi:hypothetical protein
MSQAYPVLFVSHGAPTFAIEPGLAGLSSFIPHDVEVLRVRSRLQIGADGFAWF